MHVLALVNQKGGCGKTTAAVNLAAALAEPGPLSERVLLVDLDPQAHATLALSTCADDAPSLVDVLRGNVALSSAVRAAPGGFDLLPATAELAAFEEEAERSIRPERVLDAALATLAGRYDRVVLDCPPRVDGVLSANALVACDTCVLVVETGAFALQGALRAREIVAERRGLLGREFELRTLATLFDPGTRLGREILIALQARFGESLFETAIRSHQSLREAAARGVPVQVLDAGSPAALDFAALAGEVRRLHPSEPAVGRGELRPMPSRDARRAGLGSPTRR